jgi:hypothetical protein
MRTKIVSAGFAPFTFAAGIARFNANPVANLYIFDIFSRFYNLSRKFMTVYMRIDRIRISRLAMLIKMDIGTANTAIVYPYQSVIFTAFGHFGRSNLNPARFHKKSRPVRHIYVLLKYELQLRIL